MVERVIRGVQWTLHAASASWSYLRSVARKTRDHDILFLASGLAFNGILTLIPVMLLLASALGMILNSSSLAVQQLKDFLDTIFPPQPFASSIRRSILTVISDITVYRNSLGIFGAVVLIWTATSLFDALRSVLHRVYYLKRTKGLLASFAHEVGFLFIALLLFLISSVAIWVLTALEEVAATVPALRALAVPGHDSTLPTVVVTLVTAAMFYIVYRYITDTKPPRTAAIISTLTTTALWVVSGKLFGIYLTRFSAIGSLYGPYAFILVLMVWIYYSSIVFVIGGIVGQVYWERRTAREAQGRAADRPTLTP